MSRIKEDRIRKKTQQQSIKLHRNNTLNNKTYVELRTNVFLLTSHNTNYMATSSSTCLCKFEMQYNVLKHKSSDFKSSGARNS